MFGPKKPPAPKLPWAIQILTTDYLIAGTLPPDQYTQDDADLFQAACHGYAQYVGAKAFGNRRLTGVQLQPTGPLTQPRQNFAAWLLTPATSLVAVIPNDDHSRQAALAALAACQDYKYRLTAAVYTGPYRVQGTLLTDAADRTRLGYEWSLLPVLDARVDSLLPGGQLAGWPAPFLLLNSGLIHGSALG